MRFDFTPTLLSPRLLLRPYTAQDFEALFLIASDPLIWEQHPARDRYLRPVFEKLMSEAQASTGALVIVERATGRIIGSSRFYDFDRAGEQLFIGYTFLAREYWGGALNQELKKLMLEHAFKTVSKVLFQVGKNNLRSQAALKKIGAIPYSGLPESSGNGDQCVFVIHP